MKILRLPRKAIQSLFFLFFLLSSLPCALTATDWDLVSEKRAVRLYVKSQHEGPIVPLKAEMFVPFSLPEVFCVLIDSSRKKEWVSNLGKQEVIKNLTYDERVEYFHVKFPFPLQDRDFLFHARFSVSQDSKEVEIVSRSLDNNDLKSVGRHVRGFIHESSMILKEVENGTELISVIYADPKGHIPKWAVNFFIRMLGPSTMENLRKRLEKSIYTEKQIKCMREVIQGFNEMKKQNDKKGITLEESTKRCLEDGL